MDDSTPLKNARRFIVDVLIGKFNLPQAPAILERTEMDERRKHDLPCAVGLRTGDNSHPTAKFAYHIPAQTARHAMWLDLCPDCAYWVLRANEYPFRMGREQ